MVRQMRCCLSHAPGVARGADATAFAGEGDQIVVPAGVTPGAGKAVGEDAAFEVFAKGVLYVRGQRVVVARAVELSGTGQLKPGLEVRGYSAVQQRALGVAGFVGFDGFGGCARLARLRAQWGMRVPTPVLVEMLR